MSLTLALGSALSGLQTAQRALDTTANNIANVNTEGYNRKTHEQQARVLNGVGAGVQTLEVQRTVDESLLRDLRRESGLLAELTTRSSYLDRTQDLFGKPEDNTSISHQINGLQEAFELLATEPTKLTQQQSAVQVAIDTLDQLNRMSQFVQNLRLEADRAIEDRVNELNNILRSIDTLNNQIVRGEGTSIGTSDLRDQRDIQLNRLAEIMDVTTFERQSGEVIILTSTGQSLLDRDPVTVTHTAVTQAAAFLTAAAGDFNPINANGNDLAQNVRSGELAALIEQRDSILPNLQAELDELAQSLKTEVNRVHNRGVAFPNLTSEATGTRTFVDPSQQRIAFGDATDTHLVLFDSDGTERASVSLGALMADTSFGSETTTVSATGTAYSGQLVSADTGNVAYNTAAGTITAATAGAFGDLRPGATVTLGNAVPAGNSGSYTVTGVDPTGSVLTVSPPPPVTAPSQAQGGAFTFDYSNNRGPFAISDIAAAMQAWLNDSGGPGANVVGSGLGLSATVSVSAGSGFSIDLNSTSFGFAFRDETRVNTKGSETGDAIIRFDADGDVADTNSNEADYEETVAGFSNFLGLNDMFVVGRQDWLQDSEIRSGSFRVNGTGTLVFSDPLNGLNHAQVTVSNNDSLAQIAARINATPALDGIVQAQVIPEGTGERLRLIQNDGVELVVSEVDGRNILDQLGLHASASGTSTDVSVRSEIVEDTDLISRGAVQYNSDTGEYFISRGDNQTITDLAAVFTERPQQREAGNISAGTQTFAEFSAAVLANNANAQSTAEVRISYQTSLTESLTLKAAEVGGVSLDEELSQLVIFEQAYAAAARVISVTQRLFDELNGIVR